MDQQPMAETPFHGQLSAMVDRVAGVVANGYRSEVRVKARSEINFRVVGLTLEKMLAARTNICSSYDKSRG
jgi:hypothetical protein